VTTATVPIGVPVRNTRVLVLDEDLNQVPPGVVGELCVAGLNVTRGYLNQPALTAERFVADPCSPVPGQRLYRTGDLGYHDPDGTLYFVGRADNQVKVRGYRVELGEVEAVLQTHPEVTAAVVVASEDSPGDTRLTAYVTSPGAAPDHQVLVEFLAERLPRYMIPTTTIALDQLPQTPTGKIDRNNLPAAAASPPPAPLRSPRRRTRVDDLDEAELDALLDRLAGS
jgi:acyl-coenzyme A synthetase/AMP-(fatty) acid ligase